MSWRLSGHVFWLPSLVSELHRFYRDRGRHTSLLICNGAVLLCLNLFDPHPWFLRYKTVTVYSRSVDRTPDTSSGSLIVNPIPLPGSLILFGFEILGV